jgi:hypothetical protein
MRISSPVDVAALRQEWIAVVARHADAKTQRVATRCCWERIAVDLYRYSRVRRARMLVALFEDSDFTHMLEMRIEFTGPKEAAVWLEEQLGVKLVP